MFEIIKQLDTSLLVAINGAHCNIMDTIMWIISDKYTWAPLYLVILFFIAKDRRREVWITFIAIALMILISDQTCGFFKETLQRLRPTHHPQLADILHIVNDYRGGMYGFVSSHAANSFAIAVFTSMFFRKRWITISLLTWAAVVSYSRMYLGVHYPLDIIGGTMVGCASGFLMFEVEAHTVARWMIRMKNFE